MMLLASQISQQINQWYQTPVGQELLNQITTTIDSWVVNNPGYYALTASYFNNQVNYLESSHIHSHFLMTSSIVEGTDIICNFEELPFETESLDLVIINHVFEFSENPYAVMRELYRSLIPGGKCIIIAFNPFGIYGLINLFKSKYTIPLGGNFFSVMRIRDWLSLLDFTIDKVEYIAPMGIHVAKSKKHLAWLPKLANKYMPMTGGLFALCATKQVMRPITREKKWHKMPSFMKDKIIQPTTFQNKL